MPTALYQNDSDNDHDRDENEERIGKDHRGYDRFYSRIVQYNLYQRGRQFQRSHSLSTHLLHWKHQTIDKFQSRDYVLTCRRRIQFHSALRALRRRLSPSPLCRQRHVMLLIAHSRAKAQRLLLRWKAFYRREHVRSRRRKHTLHMSLQLWQMLLRQSRRTRTVLTSLCRHLTRRELRDGFQEWTRDTVVERKVVTALRTRRQRLLYWSLHRLRLRSRQRQRRRSRVRLHIQHLLFQQRKRIPNDLDSSRRVAVSLSWMKAGLYHQGMVVIRKLLTSLSRRYQARLHMEDADKHHRRATMQNVISNLFHLRRNRIASNHRLASMFRLLRVRLHARKLHKAKNRRILQFTNKAWLKHIMKQWNKNLIAHREQQRRRQRLTKRNPVWDVVRTMQYYQQTQQRRFFVHLWQGYKQRLSNERLLVNCDHWCIAQQQRRGFRSFRRWCRKTLVRRRNAVLLSLCEDRQKARRVLRIWHTLSVDNFLSRQCRRLTAPTVSVCLLPPGGQQPVMMDLHDTLRFDRSVRRSFVHILRLVRLRKEKDQENRRRQHRRDEKNRMKERMKVQVIGGECCSFTSEKEDDEEKDHGLDDDITIESTRPIVVFSAKQLREQQRLGRISLPFALPQ
jgi:hypothetical protein